MAVLNKKAFFGLIPMILSTAQAIAQDSVQVNVPPIVLFTTMETSIAGHLIMHRPDSLLDDIEIFNPAIGGFYNDLANIGSASDPKLFSPSATILTEFGNHTFDLYRWNSSSVRFYKTNKRYSDLHYHLSGGKEQEIMITMAQNIFKNWNVGLDFNRQGSKGYLTNGKTFITNFNFFTWFRLPNERYQLFASATWNSIKNKVNGGLAGDSLYNANDFSNSDLEGLKVSLANAEQRSRNHIFSLKQFYELVTRKDSSGNNEPFIRLFHESRFERSSYAYSDNGSDTSFYEHDYFTDDFDDSLHYDQWNHKLSLQLFQTFKNLKPIHLAAFELTMGSQWFRYRQLYDTTLFNYYLEGRVRTSSLKNLFTLDVTGKYIPAGENKNNHYFRLDFGMPLLFGATMNIGLQKILQSPSLMQNFYLSDHFIWQNDFDKISSTSFFLRLNLEQYHFSVCGTSSVTGRYIYYDTLARPAQSLDSIRVSQLFIRKDFRFWKIRFNNSVWIQSTDNDIVRIPGLVSHHTLFYEDEFFTKKLGAQIGFDVHYTDSYYSNAYMPASAVFYTQDIETTNGYALVDFFVNLRIKRARIFFKIQNVGDNLVAKNYSNTLYYPMPGLVFQFGVNWRFFD